MNELKFSKRKQTSYRKKRKRPTVTVSEGVITVSEDMIQNQCDDTLKALRLKFLRIPNWLWLWIKKNAPIEVKDCMSEVFAGMPDNVVIVPVTEKYNLCLQLELKTEGGVLNKKQKKWAKETSVQVSRGVNQNIQIIEDFVEFADKLRRFLLTQEEEEK